MSNLKDEIKNLPKFPGVYEFRDKQGKIIYIGKATSLKDRVSSYFSGVHENRIEQMVSQIADVKAHKTDSVLEALILEANLIKKYQPKYNIEGKDDKSFVQVVITKEDFPRIIVDRIQNSKFKNYLKIFGPYTSKKQLEIALKLIRKIFPYHSANKVSRNCCFDHQISLCPGPHAGAISKKDYLKNIRGVKMILEGKKKNLLKELKKQMEEYSKKSEFEKAAEARNRIFALEHIRDVALISDESKHPMLGAPNIGCLEKCRIEAYDISNISGDFAAGSMVVFAGTKPDKSQYRKFKIKTVAGIDDVAMMREVLARRFKNNWPLPDLILLDGGKGHLNMAQKVVNESGYDIPVVAIAKGPTRKIFNFQFLISNKIPKNKIQKIKTIIDNRLLLANIMSEAHRFAINYHKKLRKRNWKDK